MRFERQPPQLHKTASIGSIPGHCVPLWGGKIPPISLDKYVYLQSFRNSFWAPYWQFSGTELFINSKNCSKKLLVFWKNAYNNSETILIGSFVVHVKKCLFFCSPWYEKLRLSVGIVQMSKCQKHLFQCVRVPR